MRTYGQYCGLARALDIVGDRWTLLIVRELMLSPRRFGDLLDALPGIGRNLLAARLRLLEQEGISTRRQLAPPAGARVYELTPEGRELLPALGSLARWGAIRLGSPNGEHFRPEWLGLVVGAAADRDAARGVREIYEVRVEGEAFHLRVADGAVEAGAGPAEDPDLRVTTDRATLLALVASGRLDHEPQLQVEGSPRAFERWLKIFVTNTNSSAARDHSAGS